jgi:hypothetical protein
LKIDPPEPSVQRRMAIEELADFTLNSLNFAI